MNYLKIILMLWTYNMAFDTSETANVVRGSVNAAWELNQKYCGKLLVRAIEIVCIEMQRRPTRDANKNSSIHGRHKKIKFLKEKCCKDQCNLNFIKANCPGTRKNREKLTNTTTTTSTTTTTTTTPSTTTISATTPFKFRYVLTMDDYKYYFSL